MAEEDLIFGKNRHFFGGIEPSNMSTFTVALNSAINKLQITANLPTDTIVDGQTLCSVAGAVIRRGLTNYPQDEFDGTLIADIKSSIVLTDATAVPDGTYYYAAFPYTSQGVYNRNHMNRVVVNEPADMVKFTAQSVYNAVTDVATVKIVAELPSGVSGAVIRRSTTGYPVSETDGTLFQKITASGTLIDSNVSIGTTYYYTAFPYTSTGAYNRSGNNQAGVTVMKYQYHFGYDLTIADNNPDTRVKYPTGLDNTAYTKAAMNFTSNVMNYGSWPSIAGKKFMPSPCMLTYGNVVSEYLNQNDYTKKVDNTASNVANTAFGGNAMMEWNKIWAKRWFADGIYHFRCSDIQIDETFECICNYDKNNNQTPHWYTPIYFGSLVSGKLRSISGQANYVNATRQAEMTAAKANGESWTTEVLADRLLIQDLLVMMFKTTNLQTALGTGRCAAGNTSAIGQGTMNTNGLFWGSTNQTSGVKVFGMENWWGNLWRACAGWVNVSGTQKVKLTRGTHDGSTATDYNFDGAGYITLSGATPAGTNAGYISVMKNDLPYGRIPVTASGSGTTKEADGLWFNNAQNNYAFVGGPWASALLVGPFCAYLSAASSHTHTTFGAALSCKPLVV